MFVLYSFIVAFVFCGVDFVYIKSYQLENYRVKNYVKNLVGFDFLKCDKNKLIFTNRIKRLIFCDFFLKFAIFLLFFGLVSNFWINFSIVLLLFIVGGLFVALSFFVALPIENYIKKRFIKKAKSKLKEVGCKVIAITGSFGKTSVKNILYDILKEQFDVCCTPKSFNTPMGISRTILENLKETDEFLIVEYGARRKGDIEFLAKNFGVDFGIITPIGNCHLETFGSLENIEKTKFELCQEAKDVVLFNGKSKSTKKLYQLHKTKKFLVCEENSFAFAKEAKWSEKGASFVLCVDGKEIVCKTKLLGKANIDNIVQAAAMAYLLGENLLNIKNGISKVAPIPHRLELINGGNVKVIDDSFNSNIDGFSQALEVLSQFKGKKVVVSPGMVELGKEQFQANFQAGKMIAAVADIFVLMNETNKEALLKGALAGGMTKEKIYFAKTRSEQKILLKNLLEKGDVVLFENDLPDNFK